MILINTFLHNEMHVTILASAYWVPNVVINFKCCIVDPLKVLNANFKSTKATQLKVLKLYIFCRRETVTVLFLSTYTYP